MNALYNLGTLLLHNQKIEELNLFYQNNSLNSLLILSNDQGVQKESRYFVKATKITKSGFEKIFKFFGVKI